MATLTPDEALEHLEAVHAAARALSHCWIHDQAPTQEEGLQLAGRATVSYAFLRVYLEAEKAGDGHSREP